MVGEGVSGGKSTPNWSRMDEGGGNERGSTGDVILWGVYGVKMANFCTILELLLFFMRCMGILTPELSGRGSQGEESSIFTYISKL